MLSKSSAKAFFLVGTFVCAGAFGLLTLDTIKQVPGQTNEDKMTESVVRGKHLWEKNNCMGCHTILGEGAYYAPELTKVFERRGAAFIKAMLTDPQAIYPGERKMVKYNFSEAEQDDLVAFFEWIGQMDLNGFPPQPTLGGGRSAPPVAYGQAPGTAVAADGGLAVPKVFAQMCVACHAVGGQGGRIGPALDGIGVRKSTADLIAWLEDPQAVKPGTTMPKLPLSSDQITELSQYLSGLKN